MMGMLVVWPIRFADDFFLTLWISFFWAFGIGLASDLNAWKGRVLTFLLALLPVVAGAIYYGVSFSSDESFLVAGVIPWSDAYMHFRQAAQMATEGVIHTAMNGRFLYPAYFSSLLTMTNGQLLWAEMLMGLSFATVLVMVLRATASICRAPGAMIMAFGCWLFFRERCSGLIMTENLGLLCGLLSLALFLKATERRNLWLLLFGIFMLALGFCARPGALFVLPLIVFFAAYAASHQWEGWLLTHLSRFWKSGVVMFLALVMILAAFGSNSLLLTTLYQGKKVIVNGNFPFTLYGMLTGGKWSNAASYFQWNSERAMQESLSLIKERPQLLVMGAARAYKEAVARRIFFMFHHESRPATMLLLLAVLGLVLLWNRNLKSLRPYALWVTLIAIGILASIPFIPPWDADERPLAVTFPFQALMASIGFFALVRWLIFTITKKIFFKEVNRKTSAWPLVFFSIGIFLLSVPFPISHRFFIARREALENLIPSNSRSKASLFCAGSIATLNPQNYEDVRRRMAPFLAHNLDQEFLLRLFTEQSSFGIDWGSKNFDRCIILPGVSKRTDINSWKVDDRLLPSLSNTHE